MKNPAVFLFIALLVLSGCFGENRAPVQHYGTSKGMGSAGVHIVEEGDSLWSITNRYEIAMRDIAVLNKLQPPFALTPGMRLKLPPPQEYRVREGDTLYEISRLFGVSTSEIADQNNLSPPYTLRAGQVLKMASLTRKTAPVARPIKQPPSITQVRPRSVIES